MEKRVVGRFLHTLHPFLTRLPTSDHLHYASFRTSSNTKSEVVGGNSMKSTVMQYVSLTVMMLLIAAVVSLLPERNSPDASMDASKTAANSLSVVRSVQN
jgi:hypothetical protein